jgi:hypothetical protein
MHVAEIAKTIGACDGYDAESDNDVVDKRIHICIEAWVEAAAVGSALECSFLEREQNEAMERSWN